MIANFVESLVKAVFFLFIFFSLHFFDHPSCTSQGISKDDAPGRWMADDHTTLGLAVSNSVMIMVVVVDNAIVLIF
jgi:hypothetical protein